jgi:hypothetical protein
MANSSTEPGAGPTFDDTIRSVKIPATHWWRRLLAFVGPAYMVSVGYMDPGNWAADIAGGSQFRYTLLWVLVVSRRRVRAPHALDVARAFGKGVRCVLRTHRTLPGRSEKGGGCRAPTLRATAACRER